MEGRKNREGGKGKKGREVMGEKGKRKELSASLEPLLLCCFYEYKC